MNQPAHRSEEGMAAAPFVVGIGASAGGLESLERFFGHVPLDSGLAFVVIQHLSPDFKSMMDELLARYTDLEIRRAEEGMPVEPNTIYLLPPTKEMIVSGGRLHLTDKDPRQGLTLPIDHFFRSMAQDCGDRCVAVILSGTGSDGSRGIREVHKAGGLVICESQESAKFDGMPLSAQQTGIVDIVLRSEDIPSAILDALRSEDGVLRAPADLQTEPLEGVSAVFDLLRKEYDIDFSHYKPATVSRRIERRLSLLQVEGLDEYVDRLRSDPDELNSLYKDLLIGVTKFFRDSDPFEVLERDLIPELLEQKEPGEEIRAWVAGCATGEEAYSLAILLHEALEAAARPLSLKIFATDVHKGSLEHGGNGLFDEERLAEVSDERLSRFFRKRGGGYQVAQELRQSIVFAQHNVIKDPPFTNLDLISCRNLLIYFQPPAQQKAISLFHFGLRTGGTLLLGSSETPGELSDEFEALDTHCKLYRKRRDVRLPANMRLPLSRTADGLGGSLYMAPRPAPPPTNAVSTRLYDVLLDRYMPTSLLIDEDRQLIESFGGGEKLLRIKGRQLSRDLLDLLDTDAKTAIAGALNRVVRHQQPLTFSGVTLRIEGDEKLYRMDISPVAVRDAGTTYYLITLELIDQPPLPEVPSSDEVDADQMSRDQIRHLEDDLRHTRENLQATIEELETSNEEMQATNQELVASNEELQSTNEELHSVNEELYTVNAEHQKKIDELAELNQDMEHLLQSTDIALIFLDQDLCIRKFTPQVAEVFDLVDLDVGRRIGTFSHRICYDRLVEDLQHVLETGDPLERDVRDLEDRSYFMRILPYSNDDRIEGVVLSLTDISFLEEARGQIRHLSTIVESSEDAIISVDLEGKIRSWNAGAEKLYGYPASKAVGNSIMMVVPDDHKEQTLELLDCLRRGDHLDSVEVTRRTRSGRLVDVSLALSLIRDRGGRVIGVSSISRDISEKKRAAEARAYLSAIVSSSDDAIISKTLDGIVTSWNDAAERFYGYTADEMIGQSISRIVPPDRSDEIPAILTQLRNGKAIEQFETVRLRKDGTEVEVSLRISPIRDAQNRLIGGSEIARDISVLKRTLREKQENEQRIRLLLESTAEAIYGLDNDGKCSFVNRSCCRLLGYDSAEELLGRNMHALIHHSRRDGSPYPIQDCPIYRAFTRGERVHCEEEVFTRRDGSQFFVEAWSHPVINLEGEVFGAVVTFMDITSRKEAVENLREAARRREQFLAMLSHELRNPLSAIHTATRLLNSPNVDPASDAEARNIIYRQANHVTRLLDDLLDVARITQDKISLDLSLIDLRETAEDAVVSVQALAQSCEIGIDMSLPDEPLTVMGDATRLAQIQANLLNNAIKYSPRGEHVRVQLLQEGDSAVIRVADNGSGISPEMLDSIFELFVQADNTLDRAQGGMGVGLTLVRKLVDLHQGTLTVRSEGRARGSEFEVRIPLSKAVAAIDNSDALPTNGIIDTVVVVEDQQDARTVLVRLLETVGLRVFSAEDGLGGLQLIERERPDAAIIDIGLPEIDGYEVARRIRNKCSNGLMLIALTGYGQSQDVERAMQAGFDHHLVKPLQTDELFRLLRIDGR